MISNSWKETCWRRGEWGMKRKPNRHDVAILRPLYAYRSINAQETEKYNFSHHNIIMKLKWTDYKYILKLKMYSFSSEKRMTNIPPPHSNILYLRPERKDFVSRYKHSFYVLLDTTLPVCQARKMLSWRDRKRAG